MLEHECLLKNEQVLRVSPGCRGQRAGLGVLSIACSRLAGLRAYHLLGRGLHPFTSAQLAGASGKRVSPFPHSPSSGYRGGKAS